jgi:hypothetical protein
MKKKKIQLSLSFNFVANARHVDDGRRMTERMTREKKKERHREIIRIILILS